MGGGVWGVWVRVQGLMWGYKGRLSDIGADCGYVGILGLEGV